MARKEMYFAYRKKKSRFFTEAGQIDLKNGKGMIKHIVIISPVPFHPFFHHINKFI
jgi:hypothetical protein